MDKINLDLFTAIEVTWKHITFHDFLLTMLPVLIFFVLGLSMAWLIYQAWQEQAFLEALVNQLSRERELAQQKKNFVSLSSHYLRTPLAIINNSVDLAASQGANPQITTSLKSAGQRLGQSVNGLLAAAQIEFPKSELSQRPKSIKNSVAYLAFSIIGAFVAISLAIYQLVYLDVRDAKLSTWLIELALALFIIVLIFSTRRVHKNRKVVKQYFKELIVQHRILDRQRSNLVSQALTQFKSPLDELKSNSTGLGTNKLVSVISEGIHQFESVLQKFTIFEALKMGTMATARTEFEVNEIVQRILQRRSQQIIAKSLKVETKLKLKKVTQDQLLLEYALDNIVANAIEYSPQEKKVKITATKKGDIGSIFVEDVGPGIEETKMTLLFKPFSSTEDPAENFEHQGMGLSLYLDKLIMIYIGGSIDIESKVGHGSKVNLSFPR